MLFWILFLLFGGLFLASFLKERRQFRNAVYLTLTVFFLLTAVADATTGSAVSALILIFLFVLLPLSIVPISFVFLAEGVTSIRKEGFAVAHVLSIAFGVGVWLFLLAARYLFSNAINNPVRELFALVVLAGVYVFFTFAALLLYSTFYQIVPKKRDCDFIIIHGAGLLEGRRVSPLLAGRLDKGMQVYELSGRKAKIIVSGGQGGDEQVSEAQAMQDYLLQHGIPQESILLEERSKNTLENLQFSKKIMDSLLPAYSCIFVTNDYHVFRAGTYARRIGLNAEGVGCKTAFYYWPNAFIREYIAIMLQYKKAPVFLAVLWVLGVILWELATYNF
ncbi:MULTISPECIES: YdcF family protein [Caproicibacterium]|uniref:YdcF family protein n=1 Tax=Caproicibacterium argilliputei TaxID=3030016 RepID=A0AA97DAK1_9FIRM|nr:YdcF family protein [Caproicibacterium argilliputei]WOC32467.1 YdcF family protein [Caproicibacterium argilliputei]